MVRKKERVKPVVAKPLNDTEKRNIVTNFVTSSIANNVSNNVTESNTENDTNNSNDSITNDVIKDDTQDITNKVINNETELVTEEGTKNITENVNDEGTKIVTKNVPKKVMITKSITLGKKEITAKFTSDKKQRPNYNLSEDTIEKIEKISDILGYKKAEFVDIYLNGTLAKVLKDLEKLL